MKDKYDELTYYLFGMDIERNMEWAMEAALTEDYNFSPDDVLELAEHLGKRWGVGHIVDKCKEVMNQ